MIKDIKINGKVIGKKYGVVVQLGDKGESDENCVDSPSVIYDGSIYKMWYSGYDGEKTRIHYATSKDGKKWDKHGIVINIETGNKNDAKHIHQPFVILDGNLYKMWYVNNYCKYAKLSYATSKDGIKWEKHGNITIVDDDDEYNEYYTDNPCIIKDGDKYNMWYANGEGTQTDIYYTTSTDGKIWDKYRILTTIGTHCKYSTYNIFPSYVIKDGKYYKMWFTDFDRTNSKICYTISTDNVNWDNYGIIIDIGDSGESDDNDVKSPSIIIDNDVYKIWYSGGDGKHWRIHYAEINVSDLEVALNMK